MNVRAFQLPGDQIATLGDDGAVHVWAMSTLDLKSTFSGHQGRVTGAVALDEKKL
jgi:WD40 repeat protein